MTTRTTTRDQDGDAEGPEASRMVLAGLALPMLLSSLGTSIANVALPTLARELEAPFQAVQWVVLAYLVAIAATIVTVGRLGDLVGRRRLLRGGVVVFTVASTLAGVAPSLWALVAARALQGLGAAVMMALSVALVTELLPRGRTGRALGLLATASSLGTALGPSLGGVLVAQLGWRSIFLVNVPLGALAVWLSRPAGAHERADARIEGAALDVPGTLILAATLTLYALAMTLGRGHLGALEIALLAGAALGGALFVAVEARAASPLVQLSLFRDRGLVVSLAANLIVSAVLMTTLVVGPFHLAIALGLDPSAVGLTMSVGPVVAALAGMPAGWLVDRVGAPRAMSVGLLGVVVGTLALAVLPRSLGIAGYVLPLVVVTAHYALFHAANNTAVMKDVSATSRGVVSGVLSLSRNLGLITGAAVMGAVFALASGSSDPTSASPEAVAHATRVTFGVAAGVVAVTLLVVASVNHRKMLAGLAASLAPVLVVSLAFAQPAPAVDAGRALELRSPDGSNSLRLVALAQLQYAHTWREDVPDAGAWTVNRARVGLAGTVLTRDLRYLLVVELGRGDPQLLFLTVDYTLVPEWLTIRLGRFKRPLSRSFLTSSGQLSMIDRPLTVGPGAFGDDVDVGAMVHNGTSGPFEYAIGVFRGGPSSAPLEQVHPVVAGRVGLSTEGLNGYAEADLEGGPPRFGIALAGLADLAASPDQDALLTASLDLMLKAHGLSLTSALWLGARHGGPGETAPALRALGHQTQLGYVLGGRVEPVVRYACWIPLGEGSEQHSIAAGLNVYVEGQSLKLQGAASLLFRDASSTPELRVQSQLSLSL